MKVSLLIVLVLISFSGICQGVFDTTGGRYIKPIFNAVQIIPDVFYATGIYANGQKLNLVMDIYQPDGDTVEKRPVIVLAHGGGFIQGSKADMAYSCTQFAKKGFVTISIQYRLGTTIVSSAAVTQMVIRAMQDMKNSIRFLRKSASENNPYRIHPEYIFAGGFSAGAITAVHLAYLNEVRKIPQDQNITTSDSLHNNAQYPAFDWRVKAILNIAGSVGDTNWIESGGTPIISFHGTADATVPFTSGSFGLPFGGSVAMFGSQSIFNRCKRLGIQTELRAFAGAGHDYTSALPWASDTTESRISRFLMTFLTQNVTQNDGVWKQKNDYKISLFENRWKITSPSLSFSLKIFDLNGRMLETRKYQNEKIVFIPTNTQNRMVRIENQNGPAFVKFLPARID